MRPLLGNPRRISFRSETLLSILPLRTDTWDWNCDETQQVTATVLAAAAESDMRKDEEGQKREREGEGHCWKQGWRRDVDETDMMFFVWEVVKECGEESKTTPPHASLFSVWVEMKKCEEREKRRRVMDLSEEDQNATGDAAQVEGRF